MHRGEQKTLKDRAMGEAAFPDLVREPTQDSGSCQGRGRARRRESLKPAEHSFPKELRATSKGQSAKSDWQVIIGFGNWRVIDDFAMSSFQE